MSHNHSACIPPSDYTSRAKSPQSGRGRDVGSEGNRGRSEGQWTRAEQPANTFHNKRPYGDDNEDKAERNKAHIGGRNEDGDDSVDKEDEEKQEDECSGADTNDSDEDDEEDPLDAYMKSLEGAESKKSKPNTSVGGNSEEAETSAAQESDKRGVRLDIDDTDDIEESYYKYVEESRSRKPGDPESEDSEEKQNLVDYDRDGNILGVRRVKKEIDPLPAIDHSSIKYETFAKNFYQEHDEIQKLTQEQSEELRLKLDIKVSGESPPKPVCSFAHFRFDEQLMKVIRRSEYTQPTPIQAQAIPAALLGRNIIGIAMTGSGKTAAYLWPMIVHIMGQPDLKRGDGPIALVLVPTRELALQVYGEAKKFSNSYKIAVVCAYGGGSKYEQSKDLEAGAEIVVATPGRMIDMIKLGATNLRRVTYMVLDEADRFFEMGFEAQVRSICDQVRPDRQTLLFSATFKKKIEQLARTVTDNPVKIVQKSLGEANDDVTQHVIVLPDGSKKWEWLTSKLVEFTSAGSVLIFVTRIVNSEELHKNLTDLGTEALLLHGDMEQSERNRVITSFKRKEKDIMIATDLAARGLDIAHIRTVINYDVARDIDTHIHRVGRTGRAGSKGDAYTLIIEKDKDFAGHLVKNLESSNQVVNDDLMKLAMQSHNFRKLRSPVKHKGHHYSSSSHHNKNESDTRGHQPHNHNHQHRHREHHQNYSHRHHHNRDTQHYPSGSSSGSNFRDRDGSGRSDSGSSSYNDYRKRSRWH